MTDDRRYFLVRDALGVDLAYEHDRYDVTYNLEHGYLTVNRRDDPTRIVGWYAPGQWVSALLLTADELANYHDQTRPRVRTGEGDR